MMFEQLWAAYSVVTAAVIVAAIILVAVWPRKR